jgi:hypothetical protein
VVDAVQPVRAGTEVTVKSLNGDKLRVIHGVGEALVNVSDTDFSERVKRLEEERATARASTPQAAASVAAPGESWTAQPAEETTEIKAIPSQKLAAYFLNNEVRAEQELKGNEIIVQGVVKRIAKEILGYPYVLLEGERFTDVQCLFEKSEADLLANFSVGQPLIIAGKVRGKMMNILIDDCSLVAP